MIFDRLPAFDQNPSQAIPIYRYHASQSDGLRYHYSPKSNLGEGWNCDGIAFRVPDNLDPYSVPLHQFHYDQTGTYGGWRFHFSTKMSPADSGWTYDADVFRVFDTEVEGTVPVYQYHCVQKDGWRFFLSTKGQTNSK